MRSYRWMEMGRGWLAYRTVEGVPGAVGEPPMVLLHGGGGDGTTWDALAPTFAQRRTVYLPDLRGMGRSDRVGPYSLTVLRDDLLALLDRWQLDRVVLVGHSLGGVATLLATQLAPQRVAALVLEECPPPVPLGFTIPTGLPDSAPYYDREIRPFVLAELNAPDPARWEALAAIPVPTLVLAGGPTSHLPQEAMAEMTARIPAGRLVTLPTGHHIHPNAPDAFRTAVESFLTDSAA
ncbi:alpha/beta hydrolase [Micromonospora sp. Llam7]|uniref:alpha/beta fold hydrolase n=1 Tax=Micromonospora tarapacensis TaxID=2835305 RepID=UPI001C839B01|nr:alpha/beta hydrolase [Micromonospora tarapacensis]MBX7270162.1 alpha/beta hydrolase [Micromonospora tarapacensis]